MNYGLQFKKKHFLFESLIFKSVIYFHITEIVQFLFSKIHYFAATNHNSYRSHLLLECSCYGGRVSWNFPDPSRQNVQNLIVWAETASSRFTFTNGTLRSRSQQVKFTWKILQFQVRFTCGNVVQIDQTLIKEKN